MVKWAEPLSPDMGTRGWGWRPTSTQPLASAPLTQGFMPSWACPAPTWEWWVTCGVPGGVQGRDFPLLPVTLLNVDFL